MDDAEDRTAVAVPARLEQEMALIREAIATVAAGVAPRVVVSGIRFGELLLDPARRLARESGVRLVPLWGIDDAGTDVAVERVG
ncbi:MAG TPA: hypothetical protein VNJ28_02420 [Candidatus Limnocylindrales bacterium]|nr:hypothetical protein [Candidatus Limnocylindrales bacterium]